MYDGPTVWDTAGTDDPLYGHAKGGTAYVNGGWWVGGGYGGSAASKSEDLIIVIYAIPWKFHRTCACFKCMLLGTLTKI